MSEEAPPNPDAVTSRDLDGLRVSDADRHSVVTALGRHAGDGYLTMDELEERSAHALAAKTRSDLGGLLADLPAPPDLQSPALLWAGAVTDAAPGGVAALSEVPGKALESV